MTRIRSDDNGHGTAVAGVAAAAVNDVGIAGICLRCVILPVKVLNRNGSGSYSNIAAGIIYAAKHGADVINLSLAGPYPSNVVADAIQFARNHGVVVVAAAGNEGSRQSSTRPRSRASSASVQPTAPIECTAGRIAARGSSSPRPVARTPAQLVQSAGPGGAALRLPRPWLRARQP